MVDAYFTKIKILWDELNSLITIPCCECGTAKKMSDMILSGQLVQFLMGLHDKFNSIRNQILVMNPLPRSK